MIVTVDRIREVLLRGDHVGMHAVGRALVHLNNRQTLVEQNREETLLTNNVGFQKSHAKRGTSMAKFYASRGYLTPKQVAWWQSSATDGGRPRIMIYWRQILEEANKKELTKRSGR